MAVGATVLEHRDLFLQALELLRRARAVSAEQEAEVVASYEQGAPGTRERLAQLVETLQQANFGRVVIALQESSRATRATATAAPPALAAQGRQVLERATAELQQFLRLNQPPAEALDRASERLAAMGRDLAESMKAVGKEAVGEIVRHGRRALVDIETEEMERSFLDWSLRMLPRVEQAFDRMLYGLGYFWIAVAVLLAAATRPSLRPLALVGAAVLAVVMGVFFLRWAGQMKETLAARRDELERLAAMDPQERRTYLVAKWKRREGETAAAATVNAA